MSYGLVYRFDGVGEEQYWAVNEQLGIDRSGSGDWPDGLLSHAGGPVGTGWIVSEVWTSKAAQEQFMAERLGAALGAVAVPEPTEVIESDLANFHVPD